MLLIVIPDQCPNCNKTIEIYTGYFDSLDLIMISFSYHSSVVIARDYCILTEETCTVRECTAYKAIVRPTVECYSAVWDPYYLRQSTTIDKVQRRAASWVTGKFHNMSLVSDILCDLGLRDLNQQMVDSRLSMAYKIVQGLVTIPISHFINVQRDCITYTHSSPVLSLIGTTSYLETLFHQNLWQSLKIGLPPLNM